MSLLLSFFLYTILTNFSFVKAIGGTPNFNFNQPVDISDRTPCCVDRLTTLTCGRMKLNNISRFKKRCNSDPDFAMIQCCATCFDKRFPDSALKYNLLVRRQLEDPMKSTCTDRRGGKWCKKMAQSFTEDSALNSVGGCGAFSSAFRECRNTCGYCSATMQLTVVKYDYRLATSPKRCDIKTYFARTDDELRKKYAVNKEFDPLAKLTWKRPKNNDYFVIYKYIKMKIGFIGAGKMAQALARGLVNSGRITAENIIASSPKRDVKFLDECKALGLNTTHENAEVVQKSDVIFLAVKPVHVSKVTSEIAPALSREQLVVSIALGITIRNIESLLPTKSRVVRVMPNTPSVVRAGASAFAMGSACRDGDSELVKELLSTVGFSVEVPEILIDPVTGLSGSGPSYICEFVFSK
ncbi:unnamed protein product [Caenorhabditis angaria]|uniref:Pyrroline-5-carboxylate reductase catalytic N-terminal domain-containing protein n=1 Tax=Caenorhabditis angaria TaxID=860376 RepID=A0A9P1J1F4_9PELO|nr:unnamed protein product [Caenorhabditis angaria]